MLSKPRLSRRGRTHNSWSVKAFKLLATVLRARRGLGLSPPVGERPRRMTQGGTIPRSVLMGGGPDPLRALREEIAERLNSSWKIVRLRLLPIGVEHGRLMGIGLTCVKLYNELNYEKRQAFLQG